MGLVIPRTRTVDLGAGFVGRRVTLNQEIAAQTVEDVHTIIRAIVANETAQQIALGNPPQLVEVDGRATKRLDDVSKRVVVIFGATLAAAAMRIVETQLAAAISQVSTPRSGALHDIPGHWQWLYVSGGRVTRVSAATPPKVFGINDRLILMPAGVPWATNVNQAAVGTGQLTRSRRVKRSHAKAKGAGVGFLEVATAQLKRRPDFRQFSIYAAFTKTHKVAGELSHKQGSPMIVIRPRKQLGRR